MSLQSHHTFLQYCSHVSTTFSNDTRAPYLLSTRPYRSKSPTTPTAKAKTETTPRQFRHRPVAHRLLRSALHFLLTQTNVHTYIYIHIHLSSIFLCLITHAIHTTPKSNCTHILHISHTFHTYYVLHFYFILFYTTNNLTIIVGLPTIT